jgi:hypothetical protein
LKLCALQVEFESKGLKPGIHFIGSQGLKPGAVSSYGSQLDSACTAPTAKHAQLFYPLAVDLERHDPAQVRRHLREHRLGAAVQGKLEKDVL